MNKSELIDAIAGSADITKADAGRALDATIAAIASEMAGERYKLGVVQAHIQDDPHNRTRFAIICLPHTLAMPAPTGKDCTSLIVSVPNEPGAVHDLLVPLKEHGVSMSRFESRPARSGQWEYYFYIDIAGHVSQPHVAAALQELQGGVPADREVLHPRHRGARSAARTGSRCACRRWTARSTRVPPRGNQRRLFPTSTRR